MYLSPSLRREFLDKILINSYQNYDKLLSEYKKILKNRNKVLKNIREAKSKKNEIEFWNTKFIIISNEIYKYRFKLNDFFEKHIKKSNEYFL
jgi:DNA replication and repair protein RecF